MLDQVYAVSFFYIVILQKMLEQPRNILKSLCDIYVFCGSWWVHEGTWNQSTCQTDET